MSHTRLLLIVFWLSAIAGLSESLLSFIGGDLLAARWKQWQVYFTDVYPPVSAHSVSLDLGQPAPLWSAIRGG